MDYFVKYAVDAALVIILVINILSSARKGFLRCVLSLVCVLVAIFAAVNYSDDLAQWSYDNIFDSFVASKIEQEIPDGFSSKDAAQAINQAVDYIPQWLTEQLKDIGIDIDAVSKQIASKSENGATAAEQISQEIIRPAALVLLKMVAYLVIFTVVRLALGLLINLVDKFAKLPLLRQTNRLLGGAVGALEGAVIVIIISLFLNMAVAITDYNSDKFTQAVENSKIVNIISNFQSNETANIK